MPGLPHAVAGPDVLGGDLAAGPTRRWCAGAAGLAQAVLVRPVRGLPAILVYRVGAAGAGPGADHVAAAKRGRGGGAKTAGAR